MRSARRRRGCSSRKEGVQNRFLAWSGSLSEGRRGHLPARLGNILLLVSQAALGQEGSYEILYKFNPVPHGASPLTTLLQGDGGSFYGTTPIGGESDRGTILKLDSEGVLTTLHSFAESDGTYPQATLTPGASGSFYGMTYFGGASGLGTIFKLDPGGVLTTLHSFTGSDGEYPQASLTPSDSLSYYGTTSQGGAGFSANNTGFGTIFKLDSKGVLTTLHSFAGSDGASPQASLTPGASGSFYGTTYYGGVSDQGTIFKLDPEGVLTTLHSFRGSDGAGPLGSLTPGFDGSFYGTTLAGGAADHGTIFKLDPEGVLTTLHSFIGSDGLDPYASLTPGDGGSFYGLTRVGGMGYGVIFRVDPGLGGLRLPGDSNADGCRDISDAISLLGHIFLGAPERLPCGSGENDDGANLILLDQNGDRKIDLSDPVSLLAYLFLGGPPPYSGLNCVAIPGCSAACPR